MKLRRLLPGNIELLVEKESCASQYPWSSHNLSQSIQAGNDCQIVSIEANDVGYYVVRHVADVSEILNFVIFKPHQGKGLGTRLMHLLIDKVGLSKSKEIWLEVRESNLAARKLYLQTGFVEQGVRKNYYPVTAGSDAAGTENAVLMTRMVDHHECV